jgi:hypothetical protein
VLALVAAVTVTVTDVVSVAAELSDLIISDALLIEL